MTFFLVLSQVRGALDLNDKKMNVIPAGRDSGVGF